jgi:hypothetical protein
MLRAPHHEIRAEKQSSSSPIFGEPGMAGRIVVLPQTANRAAKNDSAVPNEIMAMDA